MKALIPLFLISIALVSRTTAGDENPPPASVGQKDNEEVARLCDEDQADRKPTDGKAIDWAVVGPRDTARRSRVMQLYTAGLLKTGKDFFHAGLVLQHSTKPEDFLLCHELCVGAVFMSCKDNSEGWIQAAKRLAADSEDRFLLNIGRGQRFGTQSSQVGNAPWQLYRMEDGVNDDLRRAWMVPTLSDAKKEVMEMNQKGK